MFCHKCGSQIAEGAEFCHKCGTKVVYAAAEPDNMPVHEEIQNQEEKASESKNAAENLVNVTLVSAGNKKMDVIKAVMELLNISLAQSKDIVETTPISIKKAISLDEAEKIKRIL
ncbi:MAG: ribosomal protein L7/L12, partial [Huintestinicola sp.]